MLNPFFIGLPPSNLHFTNNSVKKLLHRVGLNTGNIFFTRALYRSVSHNELKCGYSFDPAAVEEFHDGIIIPAANWLSPRTDFSDLADLIEKTNLPCVIVGIGAQSDKPQTIPKIKEGTLRLVRIASERSSYISTRGYYTCEVLEKYGIKNSIATGCPSFLYNVTKPCHVYRNDNRTLKRIAVNTSRGLPNEKIFNSNRETDKLSLLFSRLAFQQQLDIILQAEIPDICYAMGRDDEVAHFKVPKEYLRLVYGLEAGSEKKLVLYLRQKGHAFFDIEQWLKFLEEIDFVIGTRLHGIIAMLLAGKPAVLVTHDTRTAEVAKLMSIPSISGSDFDGSIDQIQTIFQEIDLSAFNKTAIQIYYGFIDFFEKNSIKNNLSVNITDGSVTDLKI